MLYGEVYAFTIDPCTAENKALGMCVPGIDEKRFSAKAIFCLLGFNTFFETLFSSISRFLDSACYDDYISLDR